MAAKMDAFRIFFYSYILMLLGYIIYFLTSVPADLILLQVQMQWDTISMLWRRAFHKNPIPYELPTEQKFLPANVSCHRD